MPLIVGTAFMLSAVIDHLSDAIHGVPTTILLDSLATEQLKASQLA